MIFKIGQVLGVSNQKYPMSMDSRIYDYNAHLKEAGVIGISVVIQSPSLLRMNVFRLREQYLSKVLQSDTQKGVIMNSILVMAAAIAR